MCRWLVAVLVAVGLSALAAHGQPLASLGPLHVWPPYTEVYVLTSTGPVDLGPADHALPIPGGHTSLRLQLRADGYLPYQLTILPDSGSAELSDHFYLLPTSLGAALLSVFRVYPVTCILGLAVPLLLLLGAVRYAVILKGEVRRARELENILSTRTDDALLASRVGGYRIIQIIGEGGMAVVYEACRDDLFPTGPRVALKVIRAHRNDALQYLQRFRREIQITAKLSHPSIIRVLDFGDHGGLPYLVMELMRGPTLLRVSRNQPIPISTFCCILQDMLEAVSYAHENGVIHRDIKPNNVMLTEDGRAVVMDFGIAWADSTFAKTQTGALLGTPAYMAPEQLLGQPATVLSDQYSLGMTVLELLTGELPVNLDQVYGMLAGRLVGNLPAPIDMRPDLPMELDAILRRMLAREPAHRYPSLRDALDALIAYPINGSSQVRRSLAAAQHPTPVPRPGQRLGRWLLQERIGSGGMAVVYRGVPQDAPDSGQIVAIKVIQPGRLAGAETRTRFEREVRIGATLKHPNIVRVLDWDVSGSVYYMVMEYIDGRSLRSRMSPAGLAPPAALDLLRPVFDAIMYAHAQGVWHRDLKPENVLISNEGHVSVMDFGISRHVADVTITATNQLPGTPGYMSPEQFGGKNVTAAADQYSLGIMLWELIAGHQPFEDENPLVVIVKQVTDPLPTLREGRPEGGEEIDWVLARMCAKDPLRRYPDLTLALTALDSAVLTSPSPIKAPSA